MFGTKNKTLTIKDKSKRSFMTFEDINSILILFSIEDRYASDLSAIITDMEKCGKQVIVYTIEPKKNNSSNQYLTFAHQRTILRKELSWIKKLKHETINEIKRLNFDTLIDFTLPDFNTFNVLLKHNSFRFCIGTKSSDLQLYDFVLLRQPEESLLDSYNHIKSYLKNMKKG